MSSRSTTTKKKLPAKIKTEGPKGLRSGRIVMYQGQRAKVTSLVSNIQAKILIDGAKTEIRVGRKMLSFPSKAQKKGVKTAPVKIKKDIGAPKVDDVPKKKLKPVLETVPKSISQTPEYNILRPDYVVIGFTDLNADASMIKEFITDLEVNYIAFAFAKLGEGSGVEDYKNVQRVLDKKGYPRKYAKVQKFVEDIRDSEKSGMETPSLNNDIFVFDLRSSRGDWLLKLLQTIRTLGIDHIETMITLPFFEDEKKNSILHNILIIGY